LSQFSFTSSPSPSPKTSTTKFQQENKLTPKLQNNARAIFRSMRRKWNS
jgi:hypothetical protein